MFELLSCRIIGRGKRIDVGKCFTVHIASYEATFIDESKEEYVYSSELIYVNKVPSLLDCINEAIRVFYNHDTVHKKKLNCMKISNLIGARIFDLYINGSFYKRAVDVEHLIHVYYLLKGIGLYVYDVTQSLTAPSEYNLLVEKESKTC